MILIADSGSSKTHWCAFDGASRWDIYTSGINPFYQSLDEIVTAMSEELLPQLPVSIFDSLYFYGAGCAGDVQCELLCEAVLSVMSIDHVEVKSDLWAAARALCGRSSGIVCILGTGSNSCFYDGVNICEQISPLGFILGDEGSGAYLGKRLVSDVLKKQLPQEVCDIFHATYPFSALDIIQKVYREPFPNRFLASFAPFLSKNKDHQAIVELLQESFLAFFRRNVHLYQDQSQLVHFVGSVAYNFAEELQQVANECGSKVGRILREPMDALLEYHRIEKIDL